MAILVLDTAARFCAACVYDPVGDAVVSVRQDDIGRGHAEHLMGTVEAVMAQAGLGFEQLCGIAVTIGPGSFTGIRVGVAAARGFALARNLPVTGVTTLESLAVQALDEVAPTVPFATVIAGGRGQLFMQHFSAEGAASDVPQAVAEDEIAQALRADVGLLVGNAALTASERLSDPLPTAIDRPVGDILAVARSAQRFAHPPSPLYLRGADAKPQSGFALPRRAQGEIAP